MTGDELIHVDHDGVQTTISFSRDHINRTDTAMLISSNLCTLIENQRANQTPLDRIVIDFRDIDRIGSAGLNGLIGIKCKASSHGVAIVLSNVQKSVRDVFALTRLERMFEFQAADGPSVTFG